MAAATEFSDNRTLWGVFSNHTFTVAAMTRVSQWLQDCAVGNGATRTAYCQRPGLSVEALLLLSRSLGFKYKILWATSYEELEQLISNGTADFSLTFLAATPERWAKLEYLPPLNFLEIGFANREPRGSVTESLIFRPFQPTMWLCLVAVFAVVVLLVSLALAPPWSPSKVAFEIFAFTMHQRDMNSQWQKQWNKDAIHIILLAFGIFLLIIYTLYSSILVSFWCPARGVIPFTDSESLAKLVAEGKKTLYAQYPLVSLYFIQIRNSDFHGHVRMMEAIAKHPPKPYVSEDELPQALRNDRNLVSPMTSLTFAAYQRAFRFRSIKFVRDQNLASLWESIVMRKDFEHKRVFQQTFKHGFRQIIYEIGRRQYYYRHDEAPLYKEPRRPSPIILEYLAMTFYFLMAGLGVSILVFFVELAVFYRKHGQEGRWNAERSSSHHVSLASLDAVHRCVISVSYQPTWTPPL